MNRDDTQRAIEATFEDLDGFIATQTLLTALEIGLFALLAAAPRSADEVCEALGLTGGEYSRSFLRICMRLGYLAGYPDALTLGPKGQAVVDNQVRFEEYARERRHIYRDLVELGTLVRTGTNRSATLDMFGYKKGAEARDTGEQEQVADYTRNQGTTNVFWSSLLLDAVDLTGFDSVIDLGCGAGNLAAEMARRHPALDVAALDLPAVVAIAEGNLEAQGIAARVRLIGGDFIGGSLPRGFDAATIMRVLWDWSDEDVTTILANVFDMLPTGGSLMVCESMYLDEETAERERALHDVRLMLIGGKVRSGAEYAAMMREAGFVDTRITATALPNFRVVHGRRP